MALIENLAPRVAARLALHVRSRFPAELGPRPLSGVVERNPT